jgi:branched-chain amino acid transport system ATP-binding protein
MTVQENLEMGAFSARDSLGIKSDTERVLHLFPRLRERINQKGGTLSGGEQQMLAIGRAMMARPRLLLLDEPSMGLAPMLVTQIFSIIREINEQGTTVFASGTKCPDGFDSSPSRLCTANRSNCAYRNG